MPTPLEEYVRKSMETVNSKEDLEKMRMSVSKKFKLPKVVSNTDILLMLRKDEKDRYSDLLVRKPTRTLSGVSVIAVMTSPFSCPHGRCTYCPGGVESSSPQSYTGFEPVFGSFVLQDRCFKVF